MKPRLTNKVLRGLYIGLEAGKVYILENEESDVIAAYRWVRLMKEYRSPQQAEKRRVEKQRRLNDPIL